MKGVCSECGVNFDWVVVIRPQFVPVPGRRAPGWLVIGLFVAFGAGVMWFVGWLCVW